MDPARCGSGGGRRKMRDRCPLGAGRLTARGKPSLRQRMPALPDGETDGIRFIHDFMQRAEPEVPGLAGCRTAILFPDIGAVCMLSPRE